MIIDSKGERHFKADPYAVHSETRPGTASKIFRSNYKWRDSKWLEERKKTAKGYKVQRFKGLGEINPDEFKDNDKTSCFIILADLR